MTAKPTPIRRDEWYEVRCTNRRCRWHIVTIRFLSGDAVLELKKEHCPNCGRQSLRAIRTKDEAA